MYALTKTLGVLLLAALLVAFGSALAMWSETIRINTYIHTGEVRVAFGGWQVNDNGADPQCRGYDNHEGKDVAHIYVTPERYDDRHNVIKLNVTIVNAYPGYCVTVKFNVTNVGTIPVKLFNYTMPGVNSTALCVGLKVPSDTQIHPGHNSTYYLTIGIRQAAQEQTTYSFEVRLIFAQWNEVPYNSPPAPRG